MAEDVHDIHPSLANLDGTIGNAKKGLSEATTEQNYKVKRVQTAQDLESGNLRPFKHGGERNFKILYDGIKLYDDKSLTMETENILLEKDAIVSGTYLYDDNNVVLLGNPYNIYCNANHVEPDDLNHSQYVDINKNDDDDDDDDIVVVDINKNDENNDENNDKNQENDDIVVVDIDNNDNNNDKNKKYEPQKMNTMRILPDEQENDEKENDDDPEINDRIIDDNTANNKVSYINAENIAIKEARESHKLSTPKSLHQHGTQISISATIPSMDHQLNNEYPDDKINNLQDNNPSFIQTLPPKQKQQQIEQQQNDKQLSGSPANDAMINYHQQAMNNANNMNYTVTLNNNNTNINNKNESKYFFNNFIIRTVLLSVSLLLFCILSFPEWFRSQSIDYFSTSYGLSAFGIFMIFIGSFGSIFGGILEKLNISLPHKKLFIYFIMAMYTMGGFFYFVGACSVAHSYNKLSSDLSSFAGIWWTEMFYIASISIITGIDILKQFLNRWDLRVCLFLSLYVLCGFILSFCLIISGNNKLFGDSSLITIGIGYLLSSIFALIFLIIRLLNVLYPSKIKRFNKIELILMILVLIFILFTGFAYFSLAGNQTFTETATYFVGMGIFQILIGIFNTFDITFCQYLIPILC